MRIKSKKSLLAPVALSAALAMPMALAQEATPTPQTQQTQTGQDPQTRTGQDSQARMGQESRTETDQGMRTRAHGESGQWETLDNDRDGYIGRPEAAAHQELSGAFDDADTDGDGRISQQEYRKHMETRKGAHGRERPTQDPNR